MLDDRTAMGFSLFYTAVRCQLVKLHLGLELTLKVPPPFPTAGADSTAAILSVTVFGYLGSGVEE